MNYILGTSLLDCPLKLHDFGIMSLHPAMAMSLRKRCLVYLVNYRGLTGIMCNFGSGGRITSGFVPCQRC